MEHLVDNLRNPYEEMFHWIKGEIYDLHSLEDAIIARDNIDKAQKKAE